MSAARCDRCAFYAETYDGAGWGTCHRYAPRPNLAYGDDRYGWPPVNNDDWCGEYSFRVGPWPASASPLVDGDALDAATTLEEIGAATNFDPVERGGHARVRDVFRRRRT